MVKTEEMDEEIRNKEQQPIAPQGLWECLVCGLKHKNALAYRFRYCPNCGNYIDRSAETRQVVERVIAEQGSRYKAYAYISNQTINGEENEEWAAAKQLLEKELAADVMEEHGWKQEQDGSWIQRWNSER